MFFARSLESECEKLQDHEEVAVMMEAGELAFCDLGLEKESLEGATDLVTLLHPQLNHVNEKPVPMPLQSYWLQVCLVFSSCKTILALLLMVSSGSHHMDYSFEQSC